MSALLRWLARQFERIAGRQEIADRIQREAGAQMVEALREATKDTPLRVRVRGEFEIEVL